MASSVIGCQQFAFSFGTVGHFTCQRYAQCFCVLPGLTIAGNQYPAMILPGCKRFLSRSLLLNGNPHACLFVHTIINTHTVITINQYDQLSVRVHFNIHYKQVRLIGYLLFNQFLLFFQYSLPSKIKRGGILIDNLIDKIKEGTNRPLFY
jgi:hypothetical protein